MQVKVAKLGTSCTDKATELKGTLTHWGMGMDGRILYLFQPKGLDHEGQPIRKILVELERLNGIKDHDFENLDVPVEILGTPVTDIASGYTGTAVSFTRHIHGCFHVWIQPPGLNEKTKEPIEKADFALVGCTGPMIKKLSEKEIQKSIKEAPSPASYGSEEWPIVRREKEAI